MKRSTLLMNNIIHFHTCFKGLKSNCCLATSVRIIFKRTIVCYQRPSGLFSFYKENNLVHSIKNRSLEMNLQRNLFKLGDYDCIGFDLDNTLCEYKIKPMVKMEYDVMSKYLVERKGYDSKFLYLPLAQEDIDFMQRGLLLDFKKGNILKLGENGEILKASHGTKQLSEDDIISFYGESKLFDYVEQLRNDLTRAWDEDLKSQFRLLNDYFDLPASLGFARIIDTMDANGDAQYCKAGQDILSALLHMYWRDHFRTEESDYFKQLKSQPEKYINKCSDGLLNWLKEIKKSRTLFLVTGSYIDYASFTASYCLGDDWKDLFKIVVCFARKPGFFSLERPFVEISGFDEIGEIDKGLLKFDNIYSQGNWKDLQSLLSECVPSKNPRILYVGDNVIEDVYTPHKNSLCDTIAISEELSAEDIWNYTDRGHPSSEYITSKRWGSYFNIASTSPTLWGSVINKCAKVCLPSVNTLVQLPYNENIEFCGDIKEGCQIISINNNAKKV